MKRLTDYKNFWLIWLSCAGSEKGISLFKIQKAWGIKTNYLYHKEAGIGSQLFREMMRQGYIEKERKFLKPKFEWIKQFVIETNTVRVGYKDSNSLLISNWPSVQTFMQEQAQVLFSMENIKALYRGSIKSIRDEGSKILNDIFLFVLLLNVEPFCKKYGADMVIRALNMVISNEIERDLLSYFHRLKPVLAETKGLPLFIKSENDLLAVLGAYAQA